MKTILAYAHWKNGTIIPQILKFLRLQKKINNDIDLKDTKKIEDHIKHA